MEKESQLIKQACFVCCPMCDKKKCVGRFNCEKIKKYIAKLTELQKNSEKEVE